MSHEDTLMGIYLEVENEDLREVFDRQLLRMHNQDKHKHKTAPERWEYALKRVRGWNPNNN
mgnify:CR=1 FL=1